MMNLTNIASIDRLVCLSALGLCAQAFAGGINADIQGNVANTNGWYGTRGTYSGAAAASGSGTTWNGVKAGNFEVTGPLVDDQGAATSISFYSEITGNGGAWSYTPGTGSPADALMGDYGFHNSGAPNRFTLFTPSGSTTGLQLVDGTYWDIYIYSRGDNAGQGGAFTLQQSSGSITKTSSGQAWAGSFVEGSNFVKFPGVSPTAYAGGFEFSLAFDGNGAGGAGPAIINGVQLVQVSAPAIPEIVDHPSGYTGDVSDPVTLNSQAIASPAPSYQWQYSANGTSGWADVTGATLQVLDIPFATYADNGYYRVVATNSNGSVTSNAAQVSLTYPAPEIGKQPQSLAVYEGGEISLSVEATTIDPPQFQWYRGASGDTSDPIAGATSDILVIPNAQAGNAGDYWVRITDSAPTADSLPATVSNSDTASVQVLPPREGVVVLLDFNSIAEGVASTTASPADFTAAGVPGLTAADVVGNSNPLPVDSSVTSVSFDANGVTVDFLDDDSVGGTNGAYAVNNGSALLNDYVYLQSGKEGDGPTTVTLSGLNLEAGETYTLYAFGSGDGAGQVSLFTPVGGANVNFLSTSTKTGNLAVTFSTAAAYSNEPVVFTWARATSSNFAALNGIAIVPGALPAEDFQSWIGDYPGVGAMTGFEDDPDQDGLGNGVENFLGTDPSVANPGIGNVSKSGATLTFQHSQNAMVATDVSARYLWSTDLSTFHEDGASSGGTTVTFSPSPGTPVPGTTTVTATVTGSIPTKVFVVIAAEQGL